MESAMCDPLYDKAKALMLSSSHPCISNIQRGLLIGYNRAARLMESLVEDGVIEKFDTGLGGIGYRVATK